MQITINLENNKLVILIAVVLGLFLFAVSPKKFRKQIKNRLNFLYYIFFIVLAIVTFFLLITEILASYFGMSGGEFAALVFSIILAFLSLLGMGIRAGENSKNNTPEIIAKDCSKSREN